ncbi:MAG: hotdog domain-containing protein [Acidimicrobiia bacterium]
MADKPPRLWAAPAPGKLIGKGHPAGDFLEAWEWDLLDSGPGFLQIEAHVPDHVKNPLGQLFGGFTPTYVDLIAIFTVRAGAALSLPEQPEAQGAREAGPERPSERGSWRWLATTNMRVDYFEPITGPRFVVESRMEKQRGRMFFVNTRFLQDDVLAVYALTTMREAHRTIGDA